MTEVEVFGPLRGFHACRVRGGEGAVVTGRGQVLSQLPGRSGGDTVTLSLGGEEWLFVRESSLEGKNIDSEVRFLFFVSIDCLYRLSFYLTIVVNSCLL